MTALITGNDFRICVRRVNEDSCVYKLKWYYKATKVFTCTSARRREFGISVWPLHTVFLSVSV